MSVKAQLLIVAIFLQCFSISGAFAEEGVIYQAAYRLKLSDNENNSARDFFVNLGSVNGVKVGDRLQVMRAVPAVDGLWGGPSPIIDVLMGEAQVLAVSETGAIVRAVVEVPPAQLPLMQYTRFMIGDTVRVKVGLLANPAPTTLEGF